MIRKRNKFFPVIRLHLLNIFILVLTSVGIVNTQTQFQCVIGGAGSEVAWSIVQAPDGSYTLAGTTNSFGSGYDDIYITRLDINGSLQWTKTIGGNLNDGSSSIIRTSDGGYTVAGSTESYGAGFYDFFILKLDVNGSIQWCKTLGGPMFEEAISIIQTSDGGYAVAGSTTSFEAAGYDMLIAKLDVSGSLQWCRKIGSANNDAARSIVQSSDGGYAIGGIYSNRFCLIKIDSIGTLQWTRIMDGIGYGYSLIRTSDNCYAMTGYSNSFGAGNSDMNVVKFDAGGNVLWNKTFGSSAIDQAASITQTTDGGYLISGLNNIVSGMGNYDIYLVKLESSGSLQWSRNIGGTNAEYGWNAIQTIDGGYAVAGETISFGHGNDIYLVKLDAGGNTCGNSSSRETIEGNGGSSSLITPSVTIPNPLVISSIPNVSTGGNILSTCLVGNQKITSEIPSSFSLSQNYPNPFNPSTKIKFDIGPPLNPLLLKEGTARSAGVVLKIYDILGKEVATLVNEQLKPGTYETEFNGADFPSGIYFYSLETANFIETKKMILIK